MIRCTSRFFMLFPGFRFATPQAIMRPRLRRSRATALSHDKKQVNGFGGTVPTTNRRPFYIVARATPPAVGTGGVESGKRKRRTGQISRVRVNRDHFSYTATTVPLRASLCF